MSTIMLPEPGTFEFDNLNLVCGLPPGNCANFCTTACDKCSRNSVDPKERINGGENDNWEPSEDGYIRADGKVTCHFCGTSGNLIEGKCSNPDCERPYPIEWKSLPTKKVPLVEIFICYQCRYVNDHPGECENCKRFASGGSSHIKQALEIQKAFSF